jgi:hypothetical protein
MVINVEIPRESNVFQKEVGRFRNISNCNRIVDCKSMAIPVVIGKTGTISISFRKYVSTIPGNHEVKELQKSAILCTSHRLRKVLMKKNRANTRASDMGTMNSSDRMAVTNS